MARSRPRSIRHEFQAQFPAPTIELWGRPEPGWRSLHASIAATVTNPTATAMKWLMPQTRPKHFSLGFSCRISLHPNFLNRFKIDISQNVNFLSGCLERGTRETVPRRWAFFPYLATIFRRSDPPPDGLASPRRVCPSANVASSDSTSCDHALPFITTQ